MNWRKKLYVQCACVPKKYVKQNKTSIWDKKSVSTLRLYMTFYRHGQIMVNI